MIWQEVTIVLIGVAFSGLLGLVIGSHRKISVDDFEKHKESETPHANCAVHQKELLDIKTVLNRIDNRLFNLVKNTKGFDE